MSGFKGLDLLLTTQTQFINFINYLSMFNTWILKIPRICFSCPKQSQNISCSIFENPQEFGFIFFDMCLINLLSFIHHIIIIIMISTHLYFLNHALSDMGIYLSKNEGKKWTFKTYLFVKLFKQNEAKDKTIWKLDNIKKMW